MDNKLVDFHTGLNHATNEDEAWRLLLDYAQPMGMDMLQVYYGDNAEKFSCRTTYDDSWIAHYMENDLWKHDPLTFHSLMGNGTFIFGLDSQDNNPTYGQATIRLYRECKSCTRLGAGTMFPVVGPNGERLGGVILGINNHLGHIDRIPMSNWSAAIIATTATHAKIQSLQNIPLSMTKLTRRECECLLWLSKGLRTKEISELLNLSDCTVSFHINNAKTKLCAHTREQAVARAVVLGLIIP